MKRCLQAFFFLSSAFSSSVALCQSPPPFPAFTISPVSNLMQNPRIAFRDGGASTLIDGTSYWAFADTSTGADNTLSSTKVLNAPNGINLETDYNNLARFIPFTKDEEIWNEDHAGTKCKAGTNCNESLAIWPQSIDYDPTHKKVIIAFQEIRRSGSGYPEVGQGMQLEPSLLKESLS